MGADLCSTLGRTTNGAARTAEGRAGGECGWGSPSPAMRVRGYYRPPRKILGNFICQTVHFGEYLCDNWSTEWVNYSILLC